MTKKPENIMVGISIGDLNGIGSEVVLKSFEDTRMLELCTPIIFANVKIVSYLKKQLNLNVNLHGIDKIDQVVVGKVNVLNVWREGVNLEWGVEEQHVGKYAVKSFVAATQALKEGKIDVLVTAPISKVNIQSEDFSFPGHTNYLNQELDGDALMLMIQDSLRVGLLTDHVPINEVASHLTEELILKKIKTINHSLIQDFQINRPRIAVLGLNPHSGDHGVIGQEEELILKPTLKKLFEEGVMVFGPFSADGFFGSGQYEKYDAVVAAYHDQGLIPFKTLSFGKGVNYTAGLNKIRTSPDHGTGFDIAGKGIANPVSFTEAIYAALDIFKARNIYEEIATNPLKTK
ncbi:4-hydroxythreonine-4-phosphate dehydrogenase PdxA [Flavobacterium columnare NBRC 100251 = ATCC 23463]|uniref:4-hydroxythreonine-4-phosphate dehydrogenase n=2 Tax=Flavobacterium columnare TaxID=996 RepID=G8X7V7_FLACA|nr:4-hydroxythreonine-4-phosphate dehydrogenase PdxA [Flavobacterium columnare]AEW86440.1 4-hydroxythreonine-4-phosphate dehydrogenase [Flavobacterium columnare ATCC 49512]AMO20364.1 4-hydroxythreonine-4-phosphate dehydrogenase PdxA [Flavobacterium columnare]ANO49623.1 4-hydroxythreonine-4-phosphate dehydrogenase [Flavobacterium columnare]APT22440.1 4-hydroxythreonine-4-phosphate dehydrogenase PdxA [Flavobacterium columnare]AUX18324.1 4-hydroxythreonine-4-phosphate dehydrogenase [Flavobacteriu